MLRDGLIARNEVYFDRTPLVEAIRAREPWSSRRGGQVLYMVIETYTQGPKPVYARASERGRMLPPGLLYRQSWVAEPSLDRCFQLMETEDASLLDEWTAHWSDLVEFEVVPVISSADAAARAAHEEG